MKKKLFLIIIVLVFSLSFSAESSVPEKWNKLQNDICRAKVSKDDAKKLIVKYHAELMKEYGINIKTFKNFFPVKDYSAKDIGGEKGSGFKPAGYNFYDGNKHRGHPAHDIFIKDEDQDSLDDLSKEPVDVLSFTDGVVVGLNEIWNQDNELRGGIYIWIFSPQNETYYYYAHLSSLNVKIGDVVKAGDKIAGLGRTGKNAFKKRSPTHLHFMALRFDQGRMTPHNSYNELLNAKLGSAQSKIKYNWLSSDKVVFSRVKDIKTPDGFKRTKVPKGSFKEWLRNLPLRPQGEKVYLHDGKLKLNQKAHYVVVDIDTPKGDLQQCADAVMRLKAEYLYSVSKYDEISFNFVNGFAARYSKWSRGYRISVAGNKSRWIASHVLKKDYSYQNFKKYLKVVFNYANTYSLAKQMKKVSSISKIEIGHVFIKGGFPGHAVIVLDVAKNSSGEKIFLTAQSFMPAQDIHVLKSFDDISPWYRAKADLKILKTPEYVFKVEELKRFQSLD